MVIAIIRKYIYIKIYDKFHLQSLNFQQNLIKFYDTLTQFQVTKVEFSSNFTISSLTILKIDENCLIDRHSAPDHPCNILKRV